MITHIFCWLRDGLIKLRTSSTSISIASKEPQNMRPASQKEASVHILELLFDIKLNMSAGPALCAARAPAAEPNSRAKAAADRCVKARHP